MNRFCVLFETDRPLPDVLKEFNQALKAQQTFLQCQPLAMAVGDLFEQDRCYEAFYADVARALDELHEAEKKAGLFK